MSSLVGETLSAENVKSRALALGFNFVGIVRAAPSPRLDAYLRWIDAQMHGTMGYMARPDRVARRRDLNVILPGVQSMIVVGVDYGANVPESILHDPTRGRIAAYAWGIDYHDWIEPRLRELAAWLSEYVGTHYSASKSASETPSSKVYVDTGAILERSHAHEAGLGFIGKNTMLIHPQRGSQFFLGVVLTTQEFDHYDAPTTRPTMCGSCTRCLNACPTNAFPAPHILDARRCISYLTIEHKGAIDPALRPLMGNWIYGCDVCQDVCPFQRFAYGASVEAFRPADLDRAAPPLADILSLDDAGFSARYAGSPIQRIGRDRLVRNACIAAGNSRDSQFIPMLSALTQDRNELVRDHAAWALTVLEQMA